MPRALNNRTGPDFQTLPGRCVTKVNHDESRVRLSSYSCPLTSNPSADTANHDLRRGSFLSFPPCVCPIDDRHRPITMRTAHRKHIPPVDDACVPSTTRTAINDNNTMMTRCGMVGRELRWRRGKVDGCRGEEWWDEARSKM